MWTAFTGYLASPAWLIVFTCYIAWTTISEKNSLSEDKSLDDMEVLAAFIKASLPRESTGMLSWLVMNLTDSLRASLYPVIMEVG